MFQSNHLIGFGAYDGFVVPSTSYANTGGTGSRSGVITATSTITFGAGTVANLIDGTTTGSGPAYLNTGQTSGYFKFDFGVGATKYINEVKIYQNAAASGNNGSFNFRGSNDDSTYTTLGTFTNSYTSGGDQNASYVISDYSSYYRYFRLELNGVTATVNTPYVNEIEFKIN